MTVPSSNLAITGGYLPNKPASSLRVYGRFPKWGDPQLIQLFKWIFHEPALGVPHDSGNLQLFGQKPVVSPVSLQPNDSILRHVRIEAMLVAFRESIWHIRGKIRHEHGCWLRSCGYGTVWSGMVQSWDIHPRDAFLQTNIYTWGHWTGPQVSARTILNSKMMDRWFLFRAFRMDTMNYIEISPTYFLTQKRQIRKQTRWFVRKWITLLNPLIHLHYPSLFLPKWPWNPGIPHKHDNLLISHLKSSNIFKHPIFLIWFQRWH